MEDKHFLTIKFILREKISKEAGPDMFNKTGFLDFHDIIEGALKRDGISVNHISNWDGKEKIFEIERDII